MGYIIDQLDWDGQFIIINDVTGITEPQRYNDYNDADLELIARERFMNDIIDRQNRAI